MDSGDRPDTTEEFAREVLARRGQLYGAALRMTGCPAQAEDLVQEAVLRAWTFWDRFQPGTNGRAWMHRILTNTFINGYRRRRREREILGEIRRDVSDAESWERSLFGVPGEGLGDEVTVALGRLAPEFRDVIVLVDLRGKSYREAADAIGCPIGTVMSRLHRARRAMKRELSDYAVSQGYVTAQAA